MRNGGRGMWVLHMFFLFPEQKASFIVKGAQLVTFVWMLPSYNSHVFSKQFSVCIVHLHEKGQTNNSLTKEKKWITLKDQDKVKKRN